MNPIVFNKVAHAEMQKHALVWGALKGIGRGMNWGATKATEGAWGAAKGTGNLIRKKPMGALNVGFGGLIIGGGLAGNPRVPQRSISQYIPQMQSGGR